MMNVKFTICFSIIILSLSPHQIFSQELQPNSNSNPLSGFETIIGGEWHQQGGYQIFKWGLGKKSVIADNYFIVEAEAQKVSEGVWFWHPGEQQIKGYFTAINMPVEFFDYSTRFIEDGIESDLSAYNSSGQLTQYSEKWVFDDQNQISWTLYSLEGNEKKQVMGGVLKREN
ncbi:MAG: hypothetical protein RI573_11080 [Balneolaceae bacterium]|nr:hypothetical protein [Balneolaceae bacterium]